MAEPNLHRLTVGRLGPRWLRWTVCAGALSVLGPLLPGAGARAAVDAGVATGAGGGATAGELRINDELSLQRIAPDTYVVTHDLFFGANVMVARMADGAVLIASSPAETQASRALLGWIHKTLHPSRIVAVNTHFHFDGTGGNEAYLGAGVAVYGSRLTASLLRERGPGLLKGVLRDVSDPGQRARMTAMALLPPDHLFDLAQARGAGMRLSFGTEEARIVYPGPAHARDNVVVYLPARRVLFGGCMVKGTPTVGYVGDADLDHWEAALQAVAGLGAQIVVPGHGPVGGPDLLAMTARVVKGARADAAKPGKRR